MMRLLSKLNKLKIPPPLKEKEIIKRLWLILWGPSEIHRPFLVSLGPEQMYRLNLPLIGPVNYYFGVYVKSSFVKSVMKTSLNLRNLN